MKHESPCGWRGCEFCYPPALKVGDEVEIVESANSSLNGLSGLLVEIHQAPDGICPFHVKTPEGRVYGAKIVRLATPAPKIIPASELRKGMRVRAEFECVITHTPDGDYELLTVKIVENDILSIGVGEAAATTWHLISEPEPEYVDGALYEVTFPDQSVDVWRWHEGKWNRPTDVEVFLIPGEIDRCTFRRLTYAEATP